ncbi:NUDIX domain-containing protein [Acidocella aromatica]|uniref:ADP-ribose pyrophosphatase YjhB (NUDIX family) n=1 Tax=Acidocella aromatica TaxID=1303579 RepID=A0A840VEV8_9PROT|nr:NUDIX domain-containing protein [Acidocella aromatica]MBB5374368.1 ADP-ribose pyrophosphatase YjhB (NUDIX family) [Acidocella aromatica]
MDIIKDHMLTDPALKAEIVARCVAGKFGDEPSHAVHSLGSVTLPDGTQRRVHLRHAADAVLLDDHGQVALITRIHNPGRGKLAVPGGFIDEVDGKPESSRTAALREANEETGISPDLLVQAEVSQIGHRIYDRPFDIRSAWNNLPGTDIRVGEFFTVSTLGFRVKLTGDLREIPLQAADDAGDVQVYEIASLRREQFAVPDHLDMILAAAKG